MTERPGCPRHCRRPRRCHQCFRQTKSGLWPLRRWPSRSPSVLPPHPLRPDQPRRWSRRIVQLRSAPPGPTPAPRAFSLKGRLRPVPSHPLPLKHPLSLRHPLRPKHPLFRPPPCLPQLLNPRAPLWNPCPPRACRPSRRSSIPGRRPWRALRWAGLKVRSSPPGGLGLWRLSPLSFPLPRLRCPRRRRRLSRPLCRRHRWRLRSLRNQRGHPSLRLLRGFPVTGRLLRHRCRPSQPLFRRLRLIRRLRLLDPFFLR